MEGNPFNKLQQLAQKSREDGTVNQSSSDIFKRRLEQKTDAPVSIEEVEKIFGQDFFGPKQVQEVFGVAVQEAAPIPFSKAELERAKELGQQLIYQVNTMRRSGDDSNDSVKNITFQNLRKYYRRVGEGEEARSLWHATNTFSEEEFFTTEQPRVGWKLSSKECLQETGYKNYLEQMDILAKHLETVVWKNEPMPKEYVEAIKEFRAYKEKVPEVGSGKILDKKYSHELVRGFQDLQLVKLTQASPVEIAYQLVLEARMNKKVLFRGNSVRTPADVDMDLTVGRRELISIDGDDYRGIAITRDTDLTQKKGSREKLLLVRMK